MARIERYPSCEANGEAGAKRIAQMYRDKGCEVTIEHGQIPQWGSAIPTSPTYGRTEKGYTVVVKWPDGNNSNKSRRW